MSGSTSMSNCFNLLNFMLSVFLAFHIVLSYLLWGERDPETPQHASSFTGRDYYFWK